MLKSKSLAILILAAGTSSRLAEPKQLLQYRGQSLLCNACLKALELSKDVYTVLGARQDLCEHEIKDLDITILVNKDYKSGLASSIKVGISELENYKKVLIMLCDQPFIPLSHFQKLIHLSNKEDIIICSFYKNKLSVPALFTKKYFPLLLELQGDKGAKKVIEENEHRYVELGDELSFDIDTKEDVKKLKEEI